MASAGVGPGDEVIVPALSFVATAQAVLHQRATMVFVDVGLRTFTIDAADWVARAGRRVAAAPRSRPSGARLR